MCSSVHVVVIVMCNMVIVNIIMVIVIGVFKRQLFLEETQVTVEPQLQPKHCAKKILLFYFGS